MARARLKISRSAVDQLHEALESLRVFLDPDNTGCSVRREVRADFGASKYLNVWVEAQLAGALREIDPDFRAREDEEER